MPEWTWLKCCGEAIKELAKAGMIKIKDSRTIANYNITFRNKQMLPHLNIKVQIEYVYNSVCKISITNGRVEHIFSMSSVLIINSCFENYALNK